MHKLQKISKDISRINNREALGDPGTLYFNHGYISALLKHKIISRSDYHKLFAVHVKEQVYCESYIDDKGKVKQDYPDDDGGGGW